MKGENEARAEVRKPPALLERTEDFAVRAVRLFRHLQHQQDRAGWVLGKQFLRAATSIGANVEEAQAAESRNDFIHKYSIAQKEARETRYWLRVMIRSDLLPAPRVQPILDEAGEIYAIITAILRSSKGR